MIINDLKKLSYLFVFAITFSLTSCKEDEKLPQIDGFDNSDQVAASALIAKWPFNGNTRETKTTVPASEEVGSSYVDGISGKALSLKDGYLFYDDLLLTPELKKLTSDVTLSIWANVTNTKGTTENATALMLLTGAAEINASTGPAEACTAIMIESAHFPSVSDTQRVKSLIGVTKADGSKGSEDNVNWWGFDNISNPGQMVRSAGKMAHYVLTWDNAASKVNLYVNGVKATNPEWETKTGAKFTNIANMKVVFGAFMNNVGITTKAESWAKPMTGILDEARIYNKLLSTSEISALYQLEKAGR